MVTSVLVEPKPGAKPAPEGVRNFVKQRTMTFREWDTTVGSTSAEASGSTGAGTSTKAVTSSAKLQQELQREMQQARVQIEELRRESTSATEAASDANARIEAMVAELAAESERRVAASERLATMTGATAITSVAGLPEAVPLTATRQRAGIVSSQQRFSSAQSRRPEQPPAGITPPAMLLSPHRTTRSKLSIREYELILAE